MFDLDAFVIRAHEKIIDHCATRRSLGLSIRAFSGA